MLATDVNNPAFVNPQNPDSLLFVQFYWHEPEDVHKSEKAGKIVRGAKQPYIRIQRPGDTTSVIEVAVREDHKRRWPEKWLYWQMQEGLIEGSADIPGWPVEKWDAINGDQARELLHLRFHTVEMIAGASDAQVQRMGMNGLALREKARLALRERMGMETKDALAKKDEELSEMRREMAELKDLVRQSLLGGSKTIAESLDAPVAVEVVAPEPEAMSGDREALIAAYQVKFGKAPDKRLNNESILKALSG